MWKRVLDKSNVFIRMRGRWGKLTYFKSDSKLAGLLRNLHHDGKVVPYVPPPQGLINDYIMDIFCGYKSPRREQRTKWSSMSLYLHSMRREYQERI